MPFDERGNPEKCMNCIHFSYRDDPPERSKIGVYVPDGWCSCETSRGISGGKRPHKVFHMQNGCFEFEKKPKEQSEQLSIMEETNGLNQE